MPSLYSNNAALLGQYSPFLYGGAVPATNPYMPMPTGMPTSVRTQPRAPGLGSSLAGQGQGYGPLRWSYDGGWGYGNTPGQQGQYPKPFNQYGINPLTGQSYDDMQKFTADLRQRIDLQRQALNQPETPGIKRRTLNPQEQALAEPVRPRRTYYM